MTLPTRPSFLRRASIAGFAGLGLLTLAGCAVQGASAGNGATTTTGSAPSSETSSSAAYADGTYTAAADYRAPSGTESVTVELTLTGGAVTAVSATADSTDREAARFQQRFADSISATVVGEDISGLQVSRVAGASLTSTGFNTALEQIRAQAVA